MASVPGAAEEQPRGRSNRVSHCPGYNATKAKLLDSAKCSLVASFDHALLCFPGEKQSRASPPPFASVHVDSQETYSHPEAM